MSSDHDDANNNHAKKTSNSNSNSEDGKTRTGGNAANQPAVTVPPLKDRVIGHNHVRRTERDIAQDEALRQRLPQPRWQKHLRKKAAQYRFVNSRRMRLGCFLFFVVLGVVAALLLWIFDEGRPGLFVGMAMFLFSLILFWVLEILIKCPKLTEGLLYHLGLVQPVSLHRRRAGASPPGQYTMTLYEDPPDVDLETGELLDGSTSRYYGQVGYVPVDGGGDKEEFDIDNWDGSGAGVVDENGTLLLDPSGKPIYGDYAAKIHSLGGQVEQVGTQVLGTISNLGEQLISHTVPNKRQLETEYELVQMILQEQNLSQRRMTPEQFDERFQRLERINDASHRLQLQQLDLEAQELHHGSDEADDERDPTDTSEERSLSATQHSSDDD